MPALATQIDWDKVVNDLMPQLHADLADLVRIPSYAANPDAVTTARKRIMAMFAAAGVAHLEEIVVANSKGEKSTPLIYGEYPAPARQGAPTVMLYAHYDVVPPGDGWTVTQPFNPLEQKDPKIPGDTRLYGRGAADDKSGVCMHLATQRAVSKNPLPVNLKLLIEGEEETGSILEEYVATHPADPRFHADLILVDDTGNLAVGKPALTISLRGLAAVDVTVSTLNAQVHSGLYGGPVPDAFMALARILTTLQDNRGDVTVDLLHEDLGWPDIDEAQFRTDAGVRPGVDLIGTERLAKRLYGKPSVNVVGMDTATVPPMKGATSKLCASATARVSLRLAPHQDPKQAQARLVAALKAAAGATWRVQADLVPDGEGAGFAANTSGYYFGLAKKALSEAYPGGQAANIGAGGTIPLAHAFQVANPKGEVLMWGCEEPRCGIHGPNESVSYAELKSMTLAQVLLLSKIGSQHPGGTR